MLQIQHEAVLLLHARSEGLDSPGLHTYDLPARPTDQVEMATVKPE